MFEIVDTYLPCFEVLAYVVPHFNAQTRMVIRGHVLCSSCLRKTLFIFFFIFFILKVLFISFLIVGAALETVFLTQELVLYLEKC